MDWYKSKVSYTLFSDLTDKQFRAYHNLMALTAQLEAMPTQQQMLKVCHHATLKSLDEHFMTASCKLDDVLMKVLCDVDDVVGKRNYWKEVKRKQRASTDDVHKDVPKKSHHREDKIREDKIRTKKESKDLEIAFDLLWEKYPRKEGKKQAFNHYKVSLKKNKHELIELAVDNYIKKVQIEGTEPRFIKQGSTFFNNWQDYTMVEIDDSKQRTKGGKWDHLLAYK